MTDSMNKLNEKMADLTLSWLPNTDQKELTAKQKYVQERTKPSDKHQQASLERKLALTYTEKEFNKKIEEASSSPLSTKISEAKEQRTKKTTMEKKAAKKSQPLALTAPKEKSKLITRESKLADYTKELEKEFDEHQKLLTSEEKILESFTKQYFQPIVAVRGYVETEQQRKVREKNENEVARAEFIEKYKNEALLCALKIEMRKALPEEKIAKLNAEEKVQALLNAQKTKVAAINPGKISQSKDLSEARKQVFLLEQSKIQTQKNPQMLFSKEALKAKPSERTEMLSQFKSTFASAKNKVNDQLDIQAGKKKAFKPF